MTNSRYPLVAACIAMLLVPALITQADEIQPATHAAPVRLPDPSADSSVRFTQQPAHVGDQVAQQIELELNLSTSIIQSEQVAHREDSSTQRTQHRTVEVVEVAEGNVCRARVAFARSRHKTPESENPEQERVQPVEGKTYLVTRHGKKLLITDLQGNIPPREEFQIVFSSMQSLGRPNPLAEFLVGRTVAVGQTLELPKHIAEQMLGFGNELGEVRRFELQLKELAAYEGAPCAVFAASIEVALGEAAGKGDNPMKIHVTGPVVILTETSRSVVTDLSGPLSLNTVEHTRMGSFQYQAEGSMRAAVQSRYASGAPKNKSE